MRNALELTAFSVEGNKVEFTTSYSRDWAAIIFLAVDSYNLGNKNGDDIVLDSVSYDANGDPVAKFRDEVDARSFGAVLESMGAYTSSLA